MRFDRLILQLVLLSLVTSSTCAGRITHEEIPEPLRTWTEWVLHGETERDCPYLYKAPTRYCVWPTRLELHLDDAQGRFGQVWQVYGASWIRLPGDVRHWPQSVKLNGEPALVAEREGKPALYVLSGRYEITGSFVWESIPESLVIPPETGLVDLTVNGNTVRFPDLDAQGHLWLRDRDTGSRGQDLRDRLDLQVFRRVIDEIPLQVVTRIHLDVAGSQREVVLGGGLPAGFIPLRLSSRLPARLDPDGRTRLQIRPGQWIVEVAARYPQSLTELSLAESRGPWPEQEVWVFEARHHLRVVEVEGVETVDPRQTRLPAAWQNLPAYRMRPGRTMVWRVLRRGDPDPEPDKLALKRTLWLDFSGQGYTMQDEITGSMTRGWRLEATRDLQLGRVVIDGQPQFITRLPGSEKIGFEVRRGVIRLTVDSRYEADVEEIRTLGWDHDFVQASAALHLPPGWELFSISGVDNVPNTWLHRWTLLDLFLVLIAALAVGRLWGWGWAVLGLVTLGLIWHEPAAPRYVWLHILAAVALLRVVPEGRFWRVVRWYRNLSLLALVLIAVPFMVYEIRVGLFPQLEHPWQAISRGQAVISGPVPTDTVSQAMEEEAPSGARALESDRSNLPQRKATGGYDYSARIQRIDPKAKLQTGPGLPDWSWTKVDLRWNGPVQRDQNLHLIYLSPTTTLVLNFLRVLLLAGLVLRMIDWHAWPSSAMGPASKRTLLLLLIPLSWLHPQDAAAQFPTPELLQELKDRLLAPPDCLPFCAQSPRMRIEASTDALQIRLEVQAQERTGVPLPTHVGHWTPKQVMLNGSPAPALVRTPAGELWLLLDQGVHQIVLSGALPARSTVQLSLPMRPHRVEVRAAGWAVEGLDENGVPDPQLQLTRLRTGEPQAAVPAMEPSTLPPFVRVERTLHLGLEWSVQTRVVRLSPKGSAVVLEVPLLARESVVTEGIRVSEGKVLVNMATEESERSWRSVLERRPQLVLAASEATSWAEVWRADISAIWHVELSGIPVIHHQTLKARWLPEWRPWPGEQVRLEVTRPEGIEGRTLTIDNSLLRVAPGQRATDASLTLSLRSSQGGQHSIFLPEGVRLQSVTINGAAQPIRLEGRRVRLPVTPSQQSITLDWRSPEGLQMRFDTPPVDLGVSSVNATISLSLGQDRWVLMVGGPQLGPAVFFWAVLCVIALIAVGLGRIRFTPLKTRHWLLLGIGLSQMPVWVSAVVVGWLLALGLRGTLELDLRPLTFDAMQLGLGILTVVAISFLFVSVQQGLLGLPDMQISGNNSNAQSLHWYQDQLAASYPRAWVLSVPLLVYRLLMLAWALWLAFALLGWLRWGWDCFASGELWKKVHIRRRKAEQT
jgi:hypothetical protein